MLGQMTFIVWLRCGEIIKIIGCLSEKCNKKTQFFSRIMQNICIFAVENQYKIDGMICVFSVLYQYLYQIMIKFI